MNSWSFYENAAKLIPFTLKGYHGQVSIYYDVNDDPCKVGFDSLSGIHFNINSSLGYPVIHARVDEYEGSGYRMFCGWIQIITSIYRDSHDPKVARSKTFISTDSAPAFAGTDIPFAAYGYLPQLFDAPCLNLRGAAHLTWTADTFLTSVPLRAKNEPIEWLAGFCWGYEESDLPEAKPVLHPLKITNGNTWNRHLPYLQEQFGEWEFEALKEASAI
jgi:hypothetical protein